MARRTETWLIGMFLRRSTTHLLLAQNKREEQRWKREREKERREGAEQRKTRVGCKRTTAKGMASLILTFLFINHFGACPGLGLAQEESLLRIASNPSGDLRKAKPTAPTSE